MENYQGLFHQLFIADGHQQEVFELGEELEPELGILAVVDGALGIHSTGKHEDLHVLLQ